MSSGLQVDGETEETKAFSEVFGKQVAMVQTLLTEAGAIIVRSLELRGTHKFMDGHSAEVLQRFALANIPDARFSLNVLGAYNEAVKVAGTFSGLDERITSDALARASLKAGQSLYNAKGNLAAAEYILKGDNSIPVDLDSSK